MSKNKKVTEQTEQKVMTKYDLKMQKRQQEKERAKKEKRRSTIISVAVVALLVCLVASFPIRTYMVLNQTYVTIGDEEISQLEFDYHYNIVKNNYINNYGTYMSYMGIDLSGDLSTMMYTDTLTWEDMFQEMAVDSIAQAKAMKAQADAAGFAPDTDEEFQNFKESVKVGAAEVGVSVREYVRGIYGSYATVNRIEDFVRESIVNTLYYSQVEEEKAPTDDEVVAYYESNVDDYESVDYRITTVDAQLGEEPTDEEIEAAMAEARLLADQAEATVATEGELTQNVLKASAVTVLREWLFDGIRQPGDTTVIEDADNYRYYVLAYENRYLDETPTADCRVIISETVEAQTILDEWTNGEATEDSFIELCSTYSDDTTASTGGLYEGMTPTSVPEEVQAWLFEEARTAGDTTAVVSEDGYNYVVYYIGQNNPQWKLNIHSTLLSEDMNAYLEEITADYEVQDPKGNLNYLKVAAEAETAESEAAESEAATE